MARVGRVAPEPRCHMRHQLAASVLRQRLDFGVHEKGVVEFGHFAGLFACDRLQAGGERLVPFHREAGDVAEDCFELLGVMSPGSGIVSRPVPQTAE